MQTETDADGQMHREDKDTQVPRQAVPDSLEEPCREQASTVLICVNPGMGRVVR